MDNDILNLILKDGEMSIEGINSSLEVVKSAIKAELVPEIESSNETEALKKAKEISKDISSVEERVESQRIIFDRITRQIFNHDFQSSKTTEINPVNGNAILSIICDDAKEVEYSLQGISLLMSDELTLNKASIDPQNMNVAKIIAKMLLTTAQLAKKNFIEIEKYRNQLEKGEN